MGFLVPMMLITTAATAAEVWHERGVTIEATIDTSGGQLRYSGYVHLWINREPGEPEIASLNYSLHRCIYTGPGAPDCEWEGGYGEIPMSAVVSGKDSVALDIDTASLPPPFLRWGGNGGVVRAEWKLDGLREEKITGARTLISPSYTLHQSGSWTSRSAAVDGLILVGLALPASRGSLSEGNRRTIWHFDEAGDGI